MLINGVVVLGSVAAVSDAGAGQGWGPPTGGSLIPAAVTLVTWLEQTRNIRITFSSGSFHDSQLVSNLSVNLVPW
jgi:hypothetical protein